jgi:hypothetical protein
MFAAGLGRAAGPGNTTWSGAARRAADGAQQRRAPSAQLYPSLSIPHHGVVRCCPPRGARGCWPTHTDARRLADAALVRTRALCEADGIWRLTQGSTALIGDWRHTHTTGPARYRIAAGEALVVPVCHVGSADGFAVRPEPVVDAGDADLLAPQRAHPGFR